MARPTETLAGLSLFAAVVRGGSLTAAAKEFGLTRSAASKRLMQLENKLGARLLQRTTRQLTLTELGERVWQHAQILEQSLEAIDAIGNDARERVRGRLKVTCAVALGRIYVAPLLPIFLERHPDVEIVLQLDDRFVDLVGEQVDVAIRAGHLPDSSLVTRRLGSLRWVVAASPTYLEKRGEPMRPTDLLEHECLIYRNRHRSLDMWSFEGTNEPQTVQVSGCLAMNDSELLAEAACAGLGIVMLNRALVQPAMDQGRLKQLLVDYPTKGGFPVMAVYPAKENLARKTAAFVDFLVELLAPRLAADCER